MGTYTTAQHLEIFGGLPERGEAAVDPRELADRARDECPAPLSDRLIEAAATTFHAEYGRIFPSGGDAQDHDEATRAGVEAVLVLAQRSAVPS